MNILTSLLTCSTFGNYANLEAGSEDAYKLIELFRDEKMIPSTFNEIIGEFNQTEGSFSQKNLSRLSLITSDKNKNIMIGSSRIDISIDLKDDEIKEDAGNNDILIGLFEKLLEKTELKSNRLAINKNMLLKDYDNSMDKNIIKKIANPIGFYETNTPNEWTQRFVTRMNNKELGESLNIITTFNKSRILEIKNGKTLEKEVLEIIFDINTIPEKQNERFGYENIKEFINQANIYIDTIKSQMEEMLKNE